MNRDLFREAANRVRAEQFLREKAASARGVDAVTLANLARTGQRMGTEWAKVAAEKGGFFGHTALPATLMDKMAEPPPPKGVSAKAWDKILSKGPSKG